MLTLERVFELANKAHSLYFTRNVSEQGELLKMVLLNCTTDGATLVPHYRKPFDLILERAKTQDYQFVLQVFSKMRLFGRSCGISAVC